MIFTIFIEFSGIFLNLYEFISNFYHLKQLNKAQKGGILRAGPRGCDVACKAMWLCHVDACERLCGAEVTRRMIFIFIIYSVI